MTFPLEYISYVDIAVLVVLTSSVFLGLKKGFLLSLIDLVGTIAIFVMAYILAPLFSDSIMLTSSFLTIDVGNEYLNTLILEKSNELLWFVVLFVVGSVLVLFIKPIFKALDELPVIKQLNHLLGGIFGAIKTYILCLVVVFILSTPIVRNGSIVIEDSILRYVEQSSTVVWELLDNPEEINNALQDIINDNGLSEDLVDSFKSWLAENIDDEKIIESIIEEFKK
ncbi:MAG: CvpA family protein [Erysipelotrichales bacterium]|nr:CvpA family protein [Erysipelotrichales bacterium]